MPTRMRRLKEELEKQYPGIKSCPTFLQFISDVESHKAWYADTQFITTLKRRFLKEYPGIRGDVLFDEFVLAI